ncbi:hypothetical protein EUAN_06160 [Andreesenia angusta]|uniref:Uncharacterized protein n=1 Tax=Andreesenia angusta TaxID=39480 RepID=A0A1S1V8B3_9FIRM|nr:hypothetical protein EUAN_06160 [Andreesenia angusta]
MYRVTEKKKRVLAYVMAGTMIATAFLGLFSAVFSI